MTMRNVVNTVSDEAWHEVYERAIERTYKMSYTEFEQYVTGDDAMLLSAIQDRVADAMADSFIHTGEW